MTYRASKEGTEFRPLVNTDIPRTFLPDLDRQIASCNAEWFLGSCLLGLDAPGQIYPLSADEFRLHAWLLYERLFPLQAAQLLECMKRSTGATVSAIGQ